MNNKTERSKKAGGFTLVELLIVACILGILIAFAVPSYFHYLDSARKSVSVSLLKSMGTEMELYKNQKGRYPDAVNLTNFTDQDGESVLVALEQNTMQTKMFSWDGYLVSGTTYSFQAKAIDKNHTVLILTPTGVSQ